eukprot:8460788-Lingulodinium_polyedra.AAC.1
MVSALECVEFDNSTHLSCSVMKNNGAPESPLGHAGAVPWSTLGCPWVAPGSPRDHFGVAPGLPR